MNDISTHYNEYRKKIPYMTARKIDSGVDLNLAIAWTQTDLAYSKEIGEDIDWDVQFQVDAQFVNIWIGVIKKVIKKAMP